MPKASQARTNARKEEIISACAALYETMSFKDITLKDISQATSFTRTSIYNYFQTKEEIFLALLQREYDLWHQDLLLLLDTHEAMTADTFAAALSHTLARRTRMLKLLSMNHYDMEANSRMEDLVSFKRSYGAAMQAVTQCVEKFFPHMPTEAVQGFLYAFFPFLFGLYPYAYVTDKQKAAMDQADVPYPFLSLYDLTYPCVRKLLDGFH